MKQTTKKPISQIISEFLTNNKKVLFTILAIIICIIVAISIFSVVEKNKNNLMVNSTIDIIKFIFFIILFYIVSRIQ
jgi:cell division protein FtsL